MNPDDPNWGALWILFGAYLHQDYGVEYDDWRAAVRAYRTENDPALMANAIEQVDVAADIHVCGDGPDLFEALVSVRRQLDAKAVKLWCNSARRDVLPSPMLRQASHGRHAYVLSLPRTADRPRPSPSST